MRTIRPIAVAVLALLCCGGLAVAQTPVQNDNPTVDTDLTPNAHGKSTPWVQRGGARYPGTELVTDSPTSFDDELTAIAMQNPTSGFAGGARKLDCDGASKTVPIIYEYHVTPDRGQVWDRVLLGTCDGPGGYVGAIAAMPDGRVLAVGGDGVYPKREPAYTADGQQAGEPYGARHDPAGMARAWLWDGTSWTELSRADGDLPQTMRGLTALAFWDRNNRGAFGFAGGLGQLWRWSGDRFDKRYDQNSEPADVRAASRLVFRVRQIGFSKEVKEVPVAYAITAGCCGPPLEGGAPGTEHVHDVPRLLGYIDSASGSGTWFVSTIDPAMSTYGDCDGTIGHPEYLGPFTGRRCESSPDATAVQSRADLPDSFYAFTVAHGSNDSGRRVSVVATPGGPHADGEPASVITQAYCVGQNGTAFAPVPWTNEQILVPDQAIEAAHRNLSTARLVASAGDAALAYDIHATTPTDGGLPEIDVQGGPSDVAAGVNVGTGCGNGMHALTGLQSDAVPDWVVGSLGSTDVPGRGAQALAVSTTLRPALVPDAVNPHPDVNDPMAYQPFSPTIAQGYLASEYQLLPSYALNAVAVDDPSGTGWAVGDRGALVRLSSPDETSATGRATEPPPPALGAPATRPVTDDGAYAERRPLGQRELTGLVPPLVERPLVRLGTPTFSTTGSPDPTRPAGAALEDVNQIVMSRDGSQGWALGAAPNPVYLQERAEPTLYYYDGGSWSRCDSEGIAGQLPADRRCAGIASLRHNLGSSPAAKILAAARVPLERDDDPTNDDDFEVLAIADLWRASDRESPQFVLLRYRDGRWATVDDPASTAALTGGNTYAPVAMTLTSAGDGWVLERTTSRPAPRLLHLVGGHWTECTAECPDLHNATVTGLTSVGRRTYLYGARTLDGDNYPLILYRDDGGTWSADPAGGGYDPAGAVPAGGTAPAGAIRGAVASVAVAQSDHGPIGWAVGQFDGKSVIVQAGKETLGYDTVVGTTTAPPKTALLRLSARDGWRPFDDTGPVHDYLTGVATDGARARVVPSLASSAQLQVTLPDGHAYFAQTATGRLFAFDPGRERWELVAPGRLADLTSQGPGAWLDSPIQAVAADGTGGLWAAVRTTGQESGRHEELFHLTSSVHEPVFREAPNPLDDPVQSSFTGLAGAPDGTVWATTRSGSVYRYDRMTGWNTADIAGWDPGRVVTAASPANAVAVGPDGSGVVVGKAGRIARIGADGVTLDAAAGISCAAGGTGACGTTRDLRAVSVAADGAAMAGGDRRTVVYRPPGGEFAAATSPTAALNATITSVSLPAADRAWLTTDGGLVFRGELAGRAWQWERENQNARGTSLNADGFGGTLALRGVAVDRAGNGYAVGDRGLLLQRSATERPVWRRLDTGVLDDLTTVTLLGHGGVLVGGRNGLVLTGRNGRFAVARPADHVGMGERTGPVVGFAVSAGERTGDLEAWAATAGSRHDSLHDPVAGISRLWHYASTDDPALDGGLSRATPLPDTPAPRDGEIAFAAFGKTDCRLPAQTMCLDMVGGVNDYEVVARRVAQDIAGDPRRPAFAVFTGDAVDTASTAGYAAVESGTHAEFANNGPVPSTETNGPVKLRRWRDWVLGPLAERLAVFGAVGGQDLSEVHACYGPSLCGWSKRAASAGDNLAWRTALAGQAAPWGGGHAPSGDGVELQPVADSGVPASDVDVDDPSATTNGERVALSGARTHYAYDVVRDGEARLRVVVVDSSFGSLAASDPGQNPTEPGSGQQAWLERMLCQAPAEASTGEPCSRGADERALVVSNAPTYSYGAGATTATATDSVVFETLMFRYHVSAVVAGRLGWNGLYYALAPGVHTPCPGGEYPAGPPDAASPCGADTSGARDPQARANGATARLTAALNGVSPPAVADATTHATGIAGLASGSVTGVLPVVVASSAGGKFGADGSGSGTAAQGYWHGYTKVRLAASGDPGAMIVEQRPVLDWLIVRGKTHVVRPGQRMTLRGYGREVVGADSSAGASVAQVEDVTQLDRIDSPAITHRYDLLEADPGRPFLPRRDAAGAYVPLDPSVATVDRQTGVVTAGRSSHGRVYAVALLSVGRLAATYPIAFEPRRSFHAPVTRLQAPPAVPQVRVLGLTAQAIQVPSASPPAAPPPPIATTLGLPSPPALPGVPPAGTAPTTPPAPPVPPAPPAGQQAAPVNLSITPVGVSVPPTTGVTAQPTPPVNPSPPSGARREAKQRQAATAKSEEGGKAESPQHDVDLAQNRPNAMTRLESAGQPSSWVLGLEWGGGIAAMALALALGYTGVRPTPRRRRPILPAAAQQAVGRRR